MGKTHLASALGLVAAPAFAVVSGKARRALVERKIAVLIHSARNERRLHAGNDIRHPALIDIAERFSLGFVFHAEFGERAVFRIRHDRGAAETVEKPFFLHLSFQRPTRAFLL